jgi:hypothetical protein
VGVYNSVTESFSCTFYWAEREKAKLRKEEIRQRNEMNKQIAR